MTSPHSLLLDSTFLLAFETELSPRLAQAVVLEALMDRRLLIAPATSLVTVAATLGGQHPELSALLDDPEGLIQVLDVSASNALETGENLAHAGTTDLAALEVAQIHVQVSGSPIAVMTYEPKRFAGQNVFVMDMRPQL